jgi:hypothetical protein
MDAVMKKPELRRKIYVVVRGSGEKANELSWGLASGLPTSDLG